MDSVSYIEQLEQAREESLVEEASREADKQWKNEDYPKVYSYLRLLADATNAYVN